MESEPKSYCIRIKKKWMGQKLSKTSTGKAFLPGNARKNRRGGENVTLLESRRPLKCDETRRRNIRRI